MEKNDESNKEEKIKESKKIIWTWCLKLSRAENIANIRKQKIQQILKLYGNYVLFSDFN